MERVSGFFPIFATKPIQEEGTDMVHANTSSSGTIGMSKDDELFERIKQAFDLPVDEAAARLGKHPSVSWASHSLTGQRLRRSATLMYCQVYAPLCSRRLADGEAFRDGRSGR
jgi:hypothetical protein